MMAIRTEMGKDNVLLQGIVEADETYIGGKRKKDYDRSAETTYSEDTLIDPNAPLEGTPENPRARKRGRGTMKDAVLGAVARGGKVVAQLVDNIKGGTIKGFIKKFVKIDDSELITDGYKGYNDIGKEMQHEVINRSEQWEEGEIHTNTMEGFWSFVKRAWYGSHHHYTTGYTPLYLAEACYKYNYRETNIFDKFLKELWK